MDRETGGAETRMEDSLRRITERESTLKAYVHLDAEAALAEARDFDRKSDAGPLGGSAVAIKDVFDTADMPTACGSPLCAGRRPAVDAAAVAAIREAGGVVVGKSVTTEFAYLNPGVTTNPHNPAHTPGGSSSGSAASVAAHGARFATGTQTAGSIIRPAAFCGVVGFKPSFGAISRAGVAQFAESLDTMGGFGRTVADAALFVGAMARRRDLMEARKPAVAPRFGLYRAGEWGPATPEAHAMLDDVASRLARAGASVRPVDLPPPCRGMLPDVQAVMAFEGAAAMAPYAAAGWNSLSAPLQALILEGRSMSGAAHAGRLARIAAARVAFATLFGDLEAILTLSAPGEAPEGLGATGDAAFNRVWTLLGAPAIALPTGLGPKGLPLGVQLVGALNGETMLAMSALWTEDALRKL